MKSKAPTAVELNRFFASSSKRGRLDVEMQILIGCKDWLNTVPGVKCWRQNVGARDWTDDRGRHRIVHFGEPGMADLSGIAHGSRLEVEVKRPGEKPSAEQYSWLFFIDQLGGIAFWCDSVEVCQRRLREAFMRQEWPWKREWET